MMDEQAVVVVGTLSDGFRIVGPFEDFDGAADWADTAAADEQTWVATLRSPLQEWATIHAPFGAAGGKAPGGDA